MTAINKNAQKPTVKDFQLEVGSITASNTVSDECLAALNEGLIEGVM